MIGKRPRVAVLFAGGTAFRGSPVLSRGIRTAADVQPWLKEMGELGMIADIVPVFVSAGHRGDPATWSLIARHILERLPVVDGAVVLVAPAISVLTAIALDALIDRVGKPVVITPGGDDRAGGGRSNLINAIQTATADLRGPVFVSGSHIIDARTVQYDGSDQPVSGTMVGKIDFGIRLFAHLRRQADQRPSVRTVFEPHIRTITLSPALQPKQLSFGPSDRGLVIAVDSLVGVAPETLAQIATKLRPSMPVVITGCPPDLAIPTGWFRTDSPLAVATVRLMAAVGTKPAAWRTWMKRFSSPV